MAISFNAEKQRFYASYQAPFGGIDSSAFSSAINPANFAAIERGVSDSNILSPIDWRAVFAFNQAASSKNFLGYIPVTNSSTVGYIISDHDVTIVSVDGTGGFNFDVVGTYTPASQLLGYFSYVVLDAQLIWTMSTWSEIWTFDRVATTTSQLTDYVGGGFLGLLNNQLINIGGYSKLDGRVPYRVSWSATGKYGNFKPYDVQSNTGDFDAGFGDLPSISDVVVGFLALGTTAYVLRSQGITQMTPTGNGTSPFAFAPLWESELGVGSVLPDSISQYGSVGAFVSDSGIYTLGVGGLSEISGSAKKLLSQYTNAIAALAKSTVLQAGIVTARCVPYIKDTPGIYYVIGFLASVTTNDPPATPSLYHFFAIDLNNGNNCYDLGELDVALNNDSSIVSSAVGKLAFINSNYQTAPVPPAQASASYDSTWIPRTYFWPSGVMVICSGFISRFGVNIPIYQLYQLVNSCSIAAVSPSSALVLAPPAARGETINYGDAILEWLGPCQWTANTSYPLNSYAGSKAGSGDFAYVYGYAFKAISNNGISGAEEPSWSTGLGSTTTDGSVTWQCVGGAVGVFDTNAAPASSYNVVPYSSITDSNGATEVINPSSNPGVIPHGGFSQAAEPVWQGLGQITVEPKTLSGTAPVAAWTNTAVPLPPAKVEGVVISKIVPLFIAIQNGVQSSEASSLIAYELIPSTPSSTALFKFRKEQMKYGAIPTVSKVSVIAKPSNPESPGTIQVSVDGGLTYDFALITIPPSSDYATYFSDAVKSLERPQLCLKLGNVDLAEAFYQGTLADEDLI